MSLVRQRQLQRADQPRFADAALAGDQHDATFTLPDLFPTSQQQLEFFFAAVQGRDRRGLPRLETVFDVTRPRDLAHVDRLRETLECMLCEISVLKQHADKAPGFGADQQRIGLGQGLQPRRKIGRLADGRVFLRHVFSREIANHHHTRGDANARSHRHALHGLQVMQGLE